MKKLILMLMIVSAPASAGGDALETELVCARALEPGQVDQGVTFELLSNPYAWAKVLRVYENGYLGHRLILNVNVPLNPEHGVYRATDVELDVANERAKLYGETFDVVCE